MIGLVFHPLAVPIGMSAVLLMLIIWFWPTRDTKPIADPDREFTRPHDVVEAFET
jgi:hypothetical protein